MRTIRKAVIPAAGYGLNFMPATKSTTERVITNCR